MEETVMKVIETFTQEDFHGAFQMLLERYNKYIAAVRDYFEGDKSFMCVLSIKVPIRKKSGNLFNNLHMPLNKETKPNHIYLSINLSISVSLSSC